jgi:hypothetical protein
VASGSVGRRIDVKRQIFGCGIFAVTFLNNFLIRASVR